MSQSPIPEVPAHMRLCLVAVFLFGSAILAASSYILATGAGSIINVYYALVLASLIVAILPTIAIFEHPFYKWMNGYIALALAGLGATLFFAAAIFSSVATAEIYLAYKGTADPRKGLLLKIFVLGVVIAGACVVNWILLTLYSVYYGTALVDVIRSVAVPHILLHDRPQTPAQAAYYGSTLSHPPRIILNPHLNHRSLHLPLPTAADHIPLDQYPVHPPSTNEPHPPPSDHPHPLRSNPSHPSLRRDMRSELETIMED